MTKFIGKLRCGKNKYHRIRIQWFARNLDDVRSHFWEIKPKLKVSFILDASLYIGVLLTLMVNFTSWFSSPRFNSIVNPISYLLVCLSSGWENWFIGGGTFKRLSSADFCLCRRTYLGNFTNLLKSRFGWISWPENANTFVYRFCLSFVIISSSIWLLLSERVQCFNTFIQVKKFNCASLQYVSRKWQDLFAHMFNL